MASLRVLIDAFLPLTQSQVKNLDGEPKSQLETLETLKSRGDALY